VKVSRLDVRERAQDMCRAQDTVHRPFPRRGVRHGLGAIARIEYGFGPPYDLIVRLTVLIEKLELLDLRFRVQPWRDVTDQRMEDAAQPVAGGPKVRKLGHELRPCCFRAIAPLRQDAEIGRASCRETGQRAAGTRSERNKQQE